MVGGEPGERNAGLAIPGWAQLQARRRTTDAIESGGAALSVTQEENRIGGRGTRRRTTTWRMILARSRLLGADNRVHPVVTPQHDSIREASRREVFLQFLEGERAAGLRGHQHVDREQRSRHGRGP